MTFQNISWREKDENLLKLNYNENGSLWVESCTSFGTIVSDIPESNTCFGGFKGGGGGGGGGGNGGNGVGGDGNQR